MYKTARGLFQKQNGKIVEFCLKIIRDIDLILRRTVSSQKSIPIIFLGVLFLAFGLRISSLGIYQDDWVFVYNAYVRGPQGLWNFLSSDGAKFSSFMNITLFHILGFKPLHWHVAALLARWLTVMMMWLVLRRLWPANQLQNFLVSLLFAVYPFFTLQPMAFTFLHVWIGYFFLGLSIYCMILSVQRPEKLWLYCILSLIAGIITGLTLEYFMGLELLRPVILWMALRNREKDTKSRLIRAFKLWMPYILVFGIYVWWRFFVYQQTIENADSPVGLALLLSDPIAEARVILSNIFPDLLSMMVVPWSKILDPAFYNLVDRNDILFIVLSIVVSLGVFLILNYHKDEEAANQPVDTAWSRDALWFGFLVTVFGLMPPYVIGLYLNEKNPLWNSRLGLASLLGLSLLIVAIVDILSVKMKTRIMIIAMLVGFSVGYHARYTNDFRWAWRKELNLFRQLKLRVPDLRPNSAFIADQEILYYMGDYPTAYALNTVYGQPLGNLGGHADHWFFSISSNFARDLDSFMTGMDIGYYHRTLTFAGRSDQSLIISFEPDQGQCLYVLRPQDASFRRLPPLLKDASHLSALERIDTSKDASSPFLEEIGVSYPDDWCTYYQKADLARQRKNYAEVIRIWQHASEKGFSPGAYFEYMLFVEAFTELGRWNEAMDLTFDATRKFPILRLPMCDYWYSIPASPETIPYLEEIESEFRCLSDELTQ